MKDLLNRSSGLIALVSVVTLLLSLFIFKEEATAEFFFILSPVLSLALIPALHRVLHIHAPVANRRIKWVGIASVIVLITAYLTYAIAPNITLSFIFGLMFAWLVGVWLFSVNLLGLLTRVLPGVLALIGISVSFAWLYIMTVSIVFSATGTGYLDYPLLMTFQNLFIMVLIVGYGIWALSLAYLLLSGNISRKLHTQHVFHVA